MRVEQRVQPLGGLDHQRIGIAGAGAVDLVVEREEGGRSSRRAPPPVWRGDREVAPQVRLVGSRASVPAQDRRYESVHDPGVQVEGERLHITGPDADNHGARRPRRSWTCRCRRARSTQTLSMSPTDAHIGTVSSVGYHERPVTLPMSCAKTSAKATPPVAMKKSGCRESAEQHERHHQHDPVEHDHGRHAQPAVVEQPLQVRAVRVGEAVVHVRAQVVVEARAAGSPAARSRRAGTRRSWPPCGPDLEPPRRDRFSSICACSPSDRLGPSSSSASAVSPYRARSRTAGTAASTIATHDGRQDEHLPPAQHAQDESRCP